MKQCSVCNEHKPIERFYRAGKKADGSDRRRTYCGDCKRSYDRVYRDANRDAYNAEKRAWAGKNRDRRRLSQRTAQAKRRATQVSAGVFEVTLADMNRLMRQSCAASHLSDCFGDMQVDHIVPIAKGGRHSIGNLQILCARHNTQKHDKFWAEFVEAHQ